MSKISDLRQEINELRKDLAVLQSAKYQCIRDDDANLIIKFADGHEDKVPAIQLRPYQIDLQKRLYQEGIKRHLLSRPRRSGKEVESFNLLVEGAIEKPGLYIMVYPTNVRARAILWDGAMLLPTGKSLKFLDMIPSRLVKNVNKQDMKIYLNNGSVIWILGSDIDPDKLRGTNPLGIVFSEFAFQDPRVFYVMLPVLRQNGGWLIAQSTFDGMNHFYQMIEGNKNDPLWNCKVDSIDTLIDENGNPYITGEMIDEDRRAGMPEYLIQQEYYGVVQVNQETKYFAYELNAIYETNRIVSGLINPGANLYAAYDIGVNDCTAIVLFQIEVIEGKLWPNIVGYIEANNHELGWYVEEVRTFARRNNLHMHTHFFPHDAKKRSFNTGKSTIQCMHEFGEMATAVNQPNDKYMAIQAMRQKLYLCKFNKENTTRLIDCLSNYSKEFDAKLSTYKSTPIHNWASHGVDAFQTMTLALDSGLIDTGHTNQIYYYGT